MTISYFDATLLRRDVDKWECTPQEMEMIHIGLPEKTPGALCLTSDRGTSCYNLDDPKLQGLEDDLVCQEMVRWQSRVKLRIYSRSWSRLLQAWQSFHLAQRFANMIDGNEFPNSHDLAGAANEVAVYGGCNFPFLEPPELQHDQFWSTAWCDHHVESLIEWVQYHEKTLRGAKPALREFECTEEMRALLPPRFGRWIWSQVRMAHLVMPCTS